MIPIGAQKTTMLIGMWTVEARFRQETRLQVVHVTFWQGTYLYFALVLRLCEGEFKDGGLIILLFPDIPMFRLWHGYYRLLLARSVRIRYKKQM